jgi:hypothetical protein
MRPVLAALLVSVFSFSLIGPALFASADSSVPACCRRDGKHHCAMSGMDQDAAPLSGPAMAASSAKCPYFPKGGALLPHSEAALLTACEAVWTPAAGQATIQLKPDAAYCTAFSRANQKRGPPSLPSGTLAA